MSRKSQTAVIIALAAAYASFLAMDVLGYDTASTWVKYSCILLLAGTAILRALSKSAGISEKLTAPAMCLTAVADWLLLVKASERTMLPGVGVFLIVQLLYAARIASSGSYTLRAAVSVRLAAALLGGLAGFLLGGADPLTILTGVYFSQLVTSAALETIRPRERLFALGLWLFACCDICVGLYNLPLPVSEGLMNAICFGMWLFYLPSQVLIVFSAGNAARSGTKNDGKANT